MNETEVGDDAVDQQAPRERRDPRAQLDRLALLARRQRWGVVATTALLALTLGVLVGRATGEDAEIEARRAIESEVLPLALDADAVWTAGRDTRGPVSEALVALRRSDDPRLAVADLDAWLEAYDVALVRIAGVDMPAAARPVQRQFIAALTLSRDAVETLGHAAGLDDPLARRDMTTEVGRLRQRSEQLFQSARASLTDLDGGRADVGPHAPLRTFVDGRVPS